ncbi:MAG: DUF6107 family protein [Ahrensia sp.]
MHSSDPHYALWAAKIVGACAGSAISIAYILPRGRREAAIRFASGVAGGVVLGTTVGAYAAHQLGIDAMLSDFEVVLMGSSLASLFLWWAIGFLLRLADVRSGVARHFPDNNKDNRQ